MIFRNPTKLKVYIRPGITDMRKSYIALVTMVVWDMELDPYSECLFLFCGKERKLIKALYWDGNGFCLWQKKLAKGFFAWPNSEENVLNLSSQELKWILEGVDFRKKHKEIKKFIA